MAIFQDGWRSLHRNFSISALMLHLLSQPFDRFEKMYLKAREKEGRVYSIEEIQKLPQVDKTHSHAAEWEVRTKSLKAFLNYLDQREDVQRILEIGCGNGWFAAGIAAQFPEVNVVGCDLNMLELKQAEEAFDLENLDFVYANIFEDWPQQWQQYDLVVLPSSVQYFKNFKELIEQLFTFAGEVHILDFRFMQQMNWKLHASEQLAIITALVCQRWLNLIFIILMMSSKILTPSICTGHPKVGENVLHVVRSHGLKS